MRAMKSAFLILTLLTAGCSDQQLREAGREMRYAVGKRWETFRQEMDAKTKAEARRRSEARARSRAHAPAEPSGVNLAEREVLAATTVAVSKGGGLDKAGAAAIVAIAQRQRAQSLIVKRGGKVVLERRWGRQDDLHAMMQMTYPIVALTMGPLVAEGKLASLDTPLGRYLPAFREGEKGRITVRDVMTGRDGLKGPEPWPGGLYQRPYYVGFYAGTGLEGEPGQGQVLPRESVVLLGAVVKAAAGMPLDRWVASRLFEPLGIRKYRWRKDKAGTVDAWAGLWLPPADALKIGELVLNEGRWNGRQVLPRAWVIEATTPAGGPLDPDWAEEHGYGWRTGARVLFQEEHVDKLRREGYPFAERLKPAIGGVYRSHQDLQLAVAARVGEAGMAALRERARRDPHWLPCRRVAGRAFGFQAGDYIGNHLIVNPAKRLVALHTVPWDGQPITRSIATFEFDDLADRLDEAAL